MHPGKIIITLAAGFVLLVAQSAIAADAEGRFSIRGAGRVTCEFFLEKAEGRGPEVFQMTGWLNGYITGLNRTTADTYDLVAWQSSDFMMRSLATFCAANPQASFHDAVAGMINALAEDRIAARNAMVEATTEAGTIRLYQEALRRAQERLKALGHSLPGTASGLWGPETADAFAAFQRSVGMEATGLPDQLTLARLFFPPPDQQQ